MEEEEEETALAWFIKDQKLPGAGLLNHYGSVMRAIISKAVYFYNSN